MAKSGKSFGTYRMNVREPLKPRAITASNKCVEQFCSFLDSCKSKPNAECTFHGMVDGLVWSDEYPTNIKENKAIFNNIFCVLVHLRTSIILGTDLTEDETALLSTTKSKCPNWAFFEPERFLPSLRKQYELQKQRFADDLDEVFDK